MTIVTIIVCIIIMVMQPTSGFSPHPCIMHHYIIIVSSHSRRFRTTWPSSYKCVHLRYNIVFFRSYVRDHDIGDHDEAKPAMHNMSSDD